MSKQNNKNFSSLMIHEEFLKCLKAIQDGKILSPIATGLFEKHSDNCEICQWEKKKKSTKNK